MLNILFFYTSGALAADATGQIHVFGHDSDALGVDREEVAVGKEADKVCLTRLLQGQNGRLLEAKIGAKLPRKLTNKPLKGKLTEQKVGGFLVLADLAERDGARPVAALGEGLLLHEALGSNSGKVLGVLLASKGTARRSAGRGVLDGGLLHARHGRWIGCV